MARYLTGEVFSYCYCSVYHNLDTITFLWQVSNSYLCKTMFFFYSQAHNFCQFDDTWLSSNSKKYSLHVRCKEILYFQMLCFILQQNIHYNLAFKTAKYHLFRYKKLKNQLNLFKKLNLLLVITYHDGWIHLYYYSYSFIEVKFNWKKVTT